MSQLSPFLRLGEGDTLMFWCPGCEEGHMICFSPGRWTWNNDPIKPTFSPSVLVRSGHYVPGHENECWCTFYKEHPEKDPVFSCGVCHSFVKDGMIEFLNDCTHHLKGQTVPVVEWPY